MKNHWHQITNFIKIIRSNVTICIAVYSSLVAFWILLRKRGHYDLYFCLRKGRIFERFNLFCILAARLGPKLLKHLSNSIRMLKLFARALPFIGLGNLLELCLRFPGISFVVFHVRLTFFFLIGIHSMQGWTATTRHVVTRKRKRSPKKLKHRGNLFRKNLQSIGVC